MRKITKKSLLIGLILSLWGNFATAADDPTPVVDAFHSTLLTAMQQAEYEDRIATIGDAVTKHFQVHTISRISLGRHWRKLGEAEQAAVQALMSEFITTTYASRFKSFDNQQFEILGVESLSKGRKRVKSQLITKAETVTLDYQLQPTDEGWKIYDIVANGVSDLSQKRSTYNRIFRDMGVEGVKAEISSNIAANHEKVTAP